MKRPWIAMKIEDNPWFPRWIRLLAEDRVLRYFEEKYPWPKAPDYPYFGKKR